MAASMDPIPADQNKHSGIDPYGCRESKLVWEYFQRRNQGVFVDVGANHPIEYSQTWLLEQQGWTGALIEPNPDLCRLLREYRPQSRVFQTALCAPEEEGEADLHLGLLDQHSSIKPNCDAVLGGKTIRVPMRTLDSVLAEAAVDRVDFLSVDTEGTELDVLRGLNLERHQPKLILLEDMCVDFAAHNHLKAHGYKIVRRTGYNNWYVPEHEPVSAFTLSTPRELARLIRKRWLGVPFNQIRRKWKQFATNRRRGD